MCMKSIYLVLLSVLLLGCSKEDSKKDSTESDWVVDEEQVTGVLSLFPLAINPEFTSVSMVNLSDNEIVGVLDFGSEIRVYPYEFVKNNEIINDVYNGQKYAFSYCPLTYSSLAFTRESVYRASGYLYKKNLTPWDEDTESIWSQMLIKGIRGPQSNQKLNTIPVLETTWKTVRENFPAAKVVENFSASRVSSHYSENKKEKPTYYYRDSPLPDDETGEGNLPQESELVYGIIDGNGTVSIFRYSDFISSNVLLYQNYVVYGNASKGVITAFKVSNSQDYQGLENQFPLIIEDGNGVKYDILGRGTNGTTLEKPKYAYVAIWLAWDDFYDNFIFQ